MPTVPLPETPPFDRVFPRFVVGDRIPFFRNEGDAPVPERREGFLHQPWGMVIDITDPDPSAALLERVRSGAVQIGIVPVHPHGWIWMLTLDGGERIELGCTPLHFDLGVEELAFLDARRRLPLAILVLDAQLRIVAERRIDLPRGFARTVRRLLAVADRYGDTFSPGDWESEWDRRHPELVPGDEPFRHASVVVTVPALRDGDLLAAA